jgi:hypothetical protein
MGAVSDHEQSHESACTKLPANHASLAMLFRFRPVREIVAMDGRCGTRGSGMLMDREALRRGRNRGVLAQTGWRRRDPFRSARVP